MADSAFFFGIHLCVSAPGIDRASRLLRHALLGARTGPRLSLSQAALSRSHHEHVRLLAYAQLSKLPVLVVCQLESLLHRCCALKMVFARHVVKVLCRTRAEWLDKLSGLRRFADRLYSFTFRRLAGCLVAFGFLP